MTDIITKFLVEKYIYNEKCSLNSSERYLLHYISYKIGKNKNCFMKQSTMQKDTGISERHIRRLLISLTNKQILVATKKWKLNYYSVSDKFLNDIIPKSNNLSEDTMSDKNLSPDTMSSDQVHICPVTIDINIKEIKEASASAKNHKKFPTKEIIDMFNKYSSSQYPVKQITPNREQLFIQRWKEDKERQNIQWWEDFFKYLGTQCSFLHDKDFYNFAWIMNVENFVKAIEGQYEDR